MVLCTAPPPPPPPRKQEKRSLCLNRVKSLKTQAQKRFKRSLSRLRKRGSGGREGSVHQTKIDLYNMLLKFYGFVVIDDELSYCSLNSPPFALVTFYRPLLFLTEKPHLKINFFLQNTEITTLSWTYLPHIWCIGRWRQLFRLQKFSFIRANPRTNRNLSLGANTTFLPGDSGGTQTNFRRKWSQSQW